jgi:hypothetical protein
MCMCVFVCGGVMVVVVSGVCHLHVLAKGRGVLKGDKGPPAIDMSLLPF